MLDFLAALVPPVQALTRCFPEHPRATRWIDAGYQCQRTGWGLLGFTCEREVAALVSLGLAAGDHWLRTSTQQGRSGLGIEAQRQALQHFAQAEGIPNILGEYVEVETGKGSDALERRPQLKAALTAARKHRCRIAVAKLAQLAQNRRPTIIESMA